MSNVKLLLLFVPLATACSTVSTKGGTVNPEPCIFPWTYEGSDIINGKIFLLIFIVSSGITYDKCITVNDPDKKLWCSVQVDSEGNHVVGKKRWGHCNTQLCSR